MLQSKIQFTYFYVRTYNYYSVGLTTLFLLPNYRSFESVGGDDLPWNRGDQVIDSTGDKPGKQQPPFQSREKSRRAIQSASGSVLENTCSSTC